MEMEGFRGEGRVVHFHAAKTIFSPKSLSGAGGTMPEHSWILRSGWRIGSWPGPSISPSWWRWRLGATTTWRRNSTGGTSSGSASVPSSAPEYSWSPDSRPRKWRGLPSSYPMSLLVSPPCFLFFVTLSLLWRSLLPVRNSFFMPH